MAWGRTGRQRVSDTGWSGLVATPTDRVENPMLRRPARLPAGAKAETAHLRVCRVAVALLVGAALATCAVLAQQPPPPARGQAGASPRQLKGLAKLAEPWPDEATRTRHRLDAEHRRLFQSDEVLLFTLKADFKAINRDRNRATTQVHPGELSFVQDGRTVSIPVELRPRGVLRRQPVICDQVPLWVGFPKNERSKLDDTPFDGQKELKLVVHCRNDDDYEQFILREYLAYRAFNLITTRSLRARLARGNYVDAQSGKTLATRAAFFLENEDDLAKRMEARVAELPRTRFVDHDPDTLNVMMLFEFMIGNTDYSIFGLHNVIILKSQANVLYPIPYDFDVSGLVNPPYAKPDRRLMIQSLRERVYRGPCKKAEDLEPFLAKFRPTKGDILALVAKQPGLNGQSRDGIREFLEDFYSLIDSPGRVKGKLVNTCAKELM